MDALAFKEKKEERRSDESADPKLRLLQDSAVRTRHVPRGQPACSVMDPAESVYYVKAGCVKLVRYSLAGEEVVIDQYHAQSFFGDLHFCNWSLYHESKDREMAIAVEDSDVAVTTFESLKKNLSRYPEAVTALLEDYSRRLAAARLRIESFVLHEAEERLARMLLIMAAYQHPALGGTIVLKKAVTHEELANFIGVTRPFVTKLLKQLRERGFVETIAAGQLLVHRDRIVEGYSFHRLHSIA